MTAGAWPNEERWRQPREVVLGGIDGLGEVRLADSGIPGNRLSTIENTVAIPV